jgi:ankyrin repeat protein
MQRTQETTAMCLKRFQDRRVAILQPALALAVLLLPVLLPAPRLAAASSGTPLADAIEQREVKQARALIEQGAEVNAAQADGMTALHWAVYHNDFETAKSLVRAGAGVDAENRYGVTPLSLACTQGNEAIVTLLLDAGAAPNHPLPGGETPLMTAARTGKIATVKALLARGADVHAKEERQGQTALMWATAEGHAETVELLIEFGAGFRAPLDSGFTPLLFAARQGHTEVARSLLKAGADVNEAVDQRRRGARPRSGTTPLLMAVANAHFELAAMLLDAGADPNANGIGYTALHAIPSVRNPGIGDNDPPPPGSGSMTSIEFVRKIVALGADLNARMTSKVNLGNTSLNKLGATPFFLASQSADVELMRLLAELGADPLLTNEDNSTALMAATGLGTRSPGEDAGTEKEVLEAAQLALDLGIDINAVNSQGETAMHGAAYKNLPRVVEFLAEIGARPDIWNQKNEFGWTPLIIAEGYRFGNFKPSPVTIEAILKVMAAAGLEPPALRNAKSQEIY